MTSSSPQKPLEVPAIFSRFTKIIASDQASSLFDNLDAKNYFDPQFLKQKKLITGESKGRNTTWFFLLPELAESPSTRTQDYVLRHYYRGGMAAKVSKDRFFYLGLSSSRSFAEFTLLQKMRDLELPVPTPVAARIVKEGLFYSADIIMEKIPALDLVAILKQQALAKPIWQRVGKTIAQFHSNGIDHKDLNAHNIMLKDKEVFLIDFDRCQQRSPNSTWQKSNLARLKRSFEKEKDLHQGFHFEQQNWFDLLDTYDANLQPKA